MELFVSQIQTNSVHSKAWTYILFWKKLMFALSYFFKQIVSDSFMCMCVCMSFGLVQHQILYGQAPTYVWNTWTELSFSLLWRLNESFFPWIVRFLFWFNIFQPISNICCFDLFRYSCLCVCVCRESVIRAVCLFSIAELQNIKCCSHWIEKYKWRGVNLLLNKNNSRKSPINKFMFGVMINLLFVDCPMAIAGFIFWF